MEVRNSEIENQAVLVGFLCPGEKRPYELKDLLTRRPTEISQTSGTQIKGNLWRFKTVDDIFYTEFYSGWQSNHGFSERALRAYFMQFDFYQNLQFGNYTNLIIFWNTNISQTHVTCLRRVSPGWPETGAVRRPPGSQRQGGGGGGGEERGGPSSPSWDEELSELCWELDQHLIPADYSIIHCIFSLICQ